MASSFRTLSSAKDVLERHRDQMERSRDVLSRARILCNRLASEAAVVRSPSAPVLAAVRAAHASCGRVGCDGPALYRPCFVVTAGARRVRVESVPLAVCATHRDLLLAEFHSPHVLEALRHKLLERRGVADVDVEVWFQTVQ